MTKITKKLKVPEGPLFRLIAVMFHDFAVVFGPMFKSIIKAFKK